ncbi:unnamed protein product [Paramecium sonneborni]|uniref:Uncharacterized protein n=1 Tax=Paramecium sonneborni TaxID=65129 RepID=A0A8S1QQI7_9CILI|nr:unnamed protein product [Paramecium sonneborni]
MKQSKATLVRILIKIEKKKWTITNQQTFETRNPEKTMTDLVQQFQQFEFDLIQKASFGPQNLNKDDTQYGSITSTSKLKYQISILNKSFSINPILFIICNHNTQDNQLLIFKLELLKEQVQFLMDNLFIVGNILFVQQNESKEIFKGSCCLFKSTLQFLNFFSDCMRIFFVAKRQNCFITELPKVRDYHHIWQLIGYQMAETCQNLLQFCLLKKESQEDDQQIQISFIPLLIQIQELQSIIIFKFQKIMQQNLKSKMQDQYVHFL